MGRGIRQTRDGSTVCEVELCVFRGPEWRAGARWDLMNALLKISLLTLAMTVAALLLQPILWPPAPGIPSPVGVQLALFIGLAVLSALTFGAGVSFLVFGWPAVRRATAVADIPAFRVSGYHWSLVSWWPHGNRIASGDNLPDTGHRVRLSRSLYMPLIVAWFFPPHYATPVAARNP